MRILGILLLVLLAGCRTDDSTGGQPGVEPPPRQQNLTVEGSAYLSGPLSGAEVTVYHLESDKKWFLESTQTDDTGTWSVTFPEPESGVLLVEVDGGSYQDLATNEVVDLSGSGTILTGIMPVRDAGPVVTLSPVTTYQVALFQHLRNQGVDADDALYNAEETADHLLQADPLKTSVHTIDSGLGEATDNPIKYGFWLAGFSFLSEWAGHQGNVDVLPHDLLRVAREDIAADGVLDGQGVSGNLTLGDLSMEASVYQHVMALHVLVAADSDHNTTGVSLSGIESYVSYLNQLRSGFLPREAQYQPLDKRPVFAQVTPADGSAVSGELIVSAEILSVLDIQRVDLSTNGSFFGSREGREVEFRVDTNELAEGFGWITLEATDELGRSSEVTVELTVSNEGTTISQQMPGDDSVVSGEVEFSANVHDPVGVTDVVFRVDDVIVRYPQDHDRPSVSRDSTTLPSQDHHSFEVEVTNSVGTMTKRTNFFQVDNDAPEITWNLEGKEAITGQFGLIANVGDNDEVDSVKLSVDGLAVDTGLSNGILEYDIPTDNYDDGEYLVKLEARDRAGNLSTKSIMVRFDNTPPEVRLGNPWEGDVITSDFNIVAYLEDHEQLEGEVTFLIDGAEYSGTFPRSRVSTEVNASNYANNQTHTVGVRVTDKAGFTTEKSVTVTWGLPD